MGRSPRRWGVYTSPMFGWDLLMRGPERSEDVFEQAVNLGRTLDWYEEGATGVTRWLYSTDRLVYRFDNDSIKIRSRHKRLRPCP